MPSAGSEVGLVDFIIRALRLPVFHGRFLAKDTVSIDCYRPL